MSDNRPVVTRETTVCPACGGKLIPILYGTPDHKAFQASERGELVLGGCTIMGDEPQLQCAACKKPYWTRRPRR